MTKSELKSQKTSLLRNRDFVRLWAGQTVSQVGSGMGALGLMAILLLDASPAQMGILETVKAAPALLMGLLRRLRDDIDKKFR